jgi:hypothetical protein
MRIYDLRHWCIGGLYFYWCFYRECLFLRPFIMRDKSLMLIHFGPVEISNQPIF